MEDWDKATTLEISMLCSGFVYFVELQGGCIKDVNADPTAPPIMGAIRKSQSSGWVQESSLKMTRACRFAFPFR